MSSTRGFTLIEFAVVLVLIGAFFLIAIPKFNSLTEVNIKSASRRLSGVVKHLYNEAVFKKKIYKLSFDLDAGEYWVEVQEGNEFVITEDPFLRRIRLPQGVSFVEIKTDRDQVNSLGANEEFILFLPTGFVEPAVIYLRTENEDFYTLATKPYTGGMTVFDENVDLYNKGALFIHP